MAGNETQFIFFNKKEKEKKITKEEEKKNLGISI